MNTMTTTLALSLGVTLATPAHAGTLKPVAFPGPISTSSAKPGPVTPAGSSSGPSIGTTPVSSGTTPSGKPATSAPTIVTFDGSWLTSTLAKQHVVGTYQDWEACKDPSTGHEINDCIVLNEQSGGEYRTVVIVATPCTEPDLDVCRMGHRVDAMVRSPTPTAWFDSEGRHHVLGESTFHTPVHMLTPSGTIRQQRFRGTTSVAIHEYADSFFEIAVISRNAAGHIIDEQFFWQDNLNDPLAVRTGSSPYPRSFGEHHPTFDEFWEELKRDYNQAWHDTVAAGADAACKHPSGGYPPGELDAEECKDKAEHCDKVLHRVCRNMTYLAGGSFTVGCLAQPWFQVQPTVCGLLATGVGFAVSDKCEDTAQPISKTFQDECDECLDASGTNDTWCPDDEPDRGDTDVEAPGDPGSDPGECPNGTKTVTEVIERCNTLNTSTSDGEILVECQCEYSESTFTECCGAGEDCAPETRLRADDCE